ncbi:non-ribosomal peptide synthetase [Methylogaea oryzae]|nr:non-ribosomal peptide synthetase [Methylogaea oryzae]
MARRFSLDECGASIAVVGMACRLPGAQSVEALWELLASGGCAVRPIPAERWDAGRLHHPERKTPGRTVNRRAGLIDAIDGFDAGFFGISAREARAMDPQQRLLLEEAWHALEDAGIPPESLRGAKVGVYAAAMANDYQQHAASPFRVPDAYSAIGVYAALLANRLSAFFGWRGESVTVDSACASSLAALHQARLALLTGAVDYCVVAAANALLSPWKAVSFSQAGMLSEDGLCKTFADGADGYVPGEGAVVLVLRRCGDALAAGDRIHGLLLGTALNHMGPTSGITAPSVEAEAEVVRAALAQAGVDAARLSYVECHGTGTALGDPIEVEALARVLSGEGRQEPLLLGSVKTNLGHLEAAAGLAGVAKVMLMLRHGQVPPTVNLAQDNPLIDFAALPCRPARRLVPWESRPRIAGVSAFGFGGAGGHAVFAEPPAPKAVAAPPPSGQPVALALSAAADGALRALALQLAERLEQPDAPDLSSLGRALALGRASLGRRLLVVAHDRLEAAAALRRSDLPIRAKPDTAPALAIRLSPSAGGAAWRALRAELPGLERIAAALERKLRAAGFDAADPAVAEFVHGRALLALLQDCGLQPGLLSAFGEARPAALAAADALDDVAAARLARYGLAEAGSLRRPTVAYRDGDSGLELAPLRPSPAALQSLLAGAEAVGPLLALGQRLWRGNYTFRAHCEEWSDLLGASPGERLQGQPSGLDLALAVAASLWSTCARWSLRPPGEALRWPAWPLAGLVADGLLERRLALEVFAQTRPAADLASCLARAARSPERGRHPWLEQQRAYLPELEGLESPLAGRPAAPGGETADLVLAIGAGDEAPPAVGRLLRFDPAAGVAGLERVLAELWHAGLDVRRWALGQTRPHLDLPLYPFVRQSYWLPRLPEDTAPRLWETGQALGREQPAEGSGEAPIERSPAPPEPTGSRDWLALLRQCVADTLEVEAGEVDLHKSLESQGIGSLISMDLVARIELSTGLRIGLEMVDELGSVAALAERLAKEAGDGGTVPQAAQAVAPALSEGAAVRRGVRIGSPGLLDTLGVAEQALPEPGQGQVRVRVRAAGINFRDLMIALDALPEARGEPLGLEFCGEIEALGAGVSGLAPGDRVFGIAAGALAGRVNAEAALVAPAPRGLDDAAAGALPVAYLTALRCLEQLETLAPGQTVLIHAATGGLGQAALRLAQRAGARVFATAGSREKRAWLESQGVALAMDSRGLDFSSQVLAATGGRGVDLVLNSLAGAAVDHGLDCVAEGGVFVEVGKTDIRDAQEIARRRPGIRYRVYDLVGEFRRQPDMIGEALRALARRIDAGELAPLPVETFPLEQARQAFQHMARARHRGKIVLLAEEAIMGPDVAAAASSAGCVLASGEDLPLAVVGLSGRFPGADDCEALWALLEAGRCAIGEVPAGRWSRREIDGFAGDLPDPARLMRGGFLADGESFDHAFFGFSPREARATDPRQRLLLEETWLALHDAGLPWQGCGDSLRDAGIGVFVAADAGDYGFKRALGGAPGDQLALAGNLPSSLAARLAHVFDCAGPAFTVDLACSSSLGALWAAQQALLRGDCRCAVVAAVSLHSTPLLAAQLGAADLLSAGGRCLPFTLAADGLVPAEACVALVLKPLARARADGDSVHGVIRGVAVGHEGLGRGFTLPGAENLARLQAATLARAGLTAGQIDLVSAHGVGIRGGDAAEIAALAQTFGGLDQPLPLTTLKPRLGHTLAAAGLCAVVHAILQMRRNRLLPVGLDGQSWTPEWGAAPFYAPDKAVPWPVRGDGQPRRALVHTFALNGGHGAAVVEAAPADSARVAPLAPPAHSLRRRRFWLEEAEAADEAGQTLAPREAKVGAASPNTAPSAPEPRFQEALGNDCLEGLREELGQLLQEPPASLDLEATPVVLGLSSILAIELQHRLQRRFGVTLGLDDILGATRLAELAPRLAGGSGPSPEAPMAADDAPFEPFPLTDIQAAYWSGRQPGVPLGGVDCQVYWEFECARPWPAAALEASWNRLVELHPMLRAVVDGDGRQKVLNEVPRYRIEALDLTDCPPKSAEQRRRALREAMSGADLDPCAWPLFRLALSFDGRQSRLHLALNLLVMDVLSLYSLLDQLALLCDAPAAPLPAPAIGFRQCVLAMRAAADGDAWRAAERFWAERGPQLPPAPDLPMAKPLAQLGRLSTRRFQARLPAAQWRAIAAAATRHGLSPSVAFLGVFAGTLAHWTATPRFTLNLTTHTRPPIHPDVNRVVGNFTGTVLLDVDVQAGQPLRRLAARIGARLIEHLGHAAYPGVQVLRRRAAAQGWDGGLMPVVFTSMLGYENLRSGGKHSAAPLIGSLSHGATRTPQVTLDAQVQADGEGLLLSWDVAEGVFADGLAEAMFAAWVEAARALDTEAAWEWDIPAQIARREAQARAVSNGDSGPLPEEALFAPFLRQAAAHPERTALIAPDRSLNYGELAGLCADFALRLRAAGARPGELVAVAMEKGWRQVMAAIAVQMAGAAYLPLAPDLPEARFAHLAERGGVRVGLTEAGRRLNWPAGVEVIGVEADVRPSGAAAEPARVAPDSLAYVIFTSGSTGEPKGVMLSHRAALNTCLDINRRFAIGPQDRVLALSALSFDLSVWDIFGLLAAGGALVLPRPESASDPAYLAALVREQQVSVWNSVPMYLELFLAGEPAPPDVASLRIVMLSGDWIALGLAGRLRAVASQARVHSLGGATEAAIWSIHYPIGDAPRPDWSSVPYGRAMDNQTMQVLDANLQPCPDGVAGDLYIGGVGLALGYWRDPERTDAAFVTHPASGERLYRTGDLARWREEGLIEFLGRRDGQVKIDGFRVELGEVEAALRGHPAVREAVAVAPADAQGRRRLAAFCLAEADAAPEPLLEFLRTRLPSYMVPKALRILDALPLTDNEKVDRRALAELAFREPESAAAESSSVDVGELERRLAELWGEILAEGRPVSRLPDVQRNLFELGADSLMAVVAARRISNELGLPCSVTEIFEHATIGRLAGALAGRAAQSVAPAAPAAASPRPSRVDLRSAFRSRL